jgi:hypothetical protein
MSVKHAISILFLTFSIFQTQQNSLETGWYFLTENEHNGITFSDSEDVFTVEKKPIITIHDIKKVKLIEEKASTFWIKKLLLTLTKEGREKWDFATDEMSSKKKTAIFVYKNNVLCHLTIVKKRDLSVLLLLIIILILVNLTKFMNRLKLK